MSTPRSGRALGSGSARSPPRSVPPPPPPRILCCVACGGLVAISVMSYKCNIWEMKAVINACLLS